jgi:hypothetical protein
MAVKRIVANIAARQTADAKSFYADILGLHVAMDLGWIVTFTGEGCAAPQISVATEGGSGWMMSTRSTAASSKRDCRSNTGRKASLGA